MCARNNNGGFSLVELMVGSAVVVIFSVFISQSLAEISKYNKQMSEMDVGSAYRENVKQMLRRRNVSGSPDDTLCKSKLTSTLTANDLQDLFELNNRDINLNAFNPIAEKQFGEFNLERSLLKNVELLTESNAYQVSAPGVFSPAILPEARVRVVQAEWLFELRFKNRREIPKPIRIKMAIQKLGSGYNLLNCGYDQLANSISHIQACKTLGADFEFVYDNFNGPGTGQCYAPIYDPCYEAASDADRTACENTNAAYTGTKDFKVTHLAPLKTVFCQLLIQGKSYTFPFCTGVK